MEAQPSMTPTVARALGIVVPVRSWATDNRPLWMRALESRLLVSRHGCTAISITTRKPCRCRAFFLNRHGDPRCGNHART